jgi:Icc-related predicted phosphoesterase
MTRVLGFSDLHADPALSAGIVAASGAADVVLGAGDFCNMRRGLAGAMAMLAPVADKAVFVPGNAESAEELRAATAATVLHGQAAVLAGVRVFGLGHAVPVTPFGAWSCDLTEAQAEAILAAAGEVDVLLCHAPPKGLGDVTSGGLSVGSVAIRAAVARLQPQLMLCGHIHDSRGVRGRIGRTEVVNLGPRPVWFDL